MSPWSERLYRMLPAVHQIRDGEQGEPLRQFLGVIGEQVQLIEEDIQQLYDNWFIETSQDWVVPYLAELVDYRRAANAGHPGDGAAGRGEALNRFLYPRREIANLVRRRRRKGTLSVLEDVARDVTEWKARAVEFGRLVSMFQHSRHPQRWLGRTVDTRCPQDNVRLNTPFDRLAHTVDVRKIESLPGRGWYHPSKVGLFVWRRNIYSMSRIRPCRVCISHGKHIRAYTFNRLGLRLPLYVKPIIETDEFDQADERHVPVPLYRHLLRDPKQNQASSEFYGEAEEGKPRSLAVYVQWRQNDKLALIPADHIRVCDLSSEKSWHKVSHALPHDCVAVDPECGLLLFHCRVKPHIVEVSYHYAFSKDMGGGEYSRRLTAGVDRQTVRLNQGQKDRTNAPLQLFPLTHKTIGLIGQPSDGSQELRLIFQRETLEAKKTNHARRSHQADERHAVEWQVNEDLCIELIGSKEYEIYAHDTLRIADNKTLEIRASSGSWPLLHIRASHSDNCGNPWRVLLGKGSRLILDGLLICGSTLQVELLPEASDVPEPPKQGCCGATPGTDEALCSCDMLEVEDAKCAFTQPAALIVRHSTFVPGGRATERGCRCQPNHASIAMLLSGARLVITDSIVGTLNIESPSCACKAEAESPVCPIDPIAVSISDSILDAAYGQPAILGECCYPAHADLTCERTTILGDICVQRISRAEDSLFTGIVHVQRRSQGYMRFCYVPREETEYAHWDERETENRNLSTTRSMYEFYSKFVYEGIPNAFEANCCTIVRTPPRFKCVPEGSHSSDVLESQPCCGAESAVVGPAATQLAAPKFVSTRYGAPGYAELSLENSPAILRGAEDESEFGAFHDLYNPQRSAALEARLQEYTPADFESAVIYADDLHHSSFGCHRHKPCSSTE